MTISNRFHPFRFNPIAAVAVVLLLPVLSFGQVSTATVNGTVTDEQGAVIPGADLT